MEGKPEPEVFLGVRGSEGSAWRVRNRVFDEESSNSTRTRLRSVIPEEGVTRERYKGVDCLIALARLHMHLDELQVVSPGWPSYF